MKLNFIPLGGLDEVGKNMFLMEGEKEVLIFDCGVGFADEFMQGVDIIIPDFEYLKKIKNKKFYMLVTHAHEDHIGALGYFYDWFQADLYASPFTCAFVENHLKKFNKVIPIYQLSPLQTVRLKEFSFYTIPVNHSIPDSRSFVVEHEKGRFLFTGDFRIDDEPIYDKPFPYELFEKEGKKGIDILIMDSTNAPIPGKNPTEISVYPEIKKYFQSRQRIIATTFSSHIERIGMFIRAAAETSRFVFVSGRGFETSIETAQKFGYLTEHPNIIRPLEEASEYKDHQICFLATGSQAEYRSSMFRIFQESHAQIKIIPGDIVLISSKIIPGNEKSIHKMINSLSKLGADVFFENNSNIHVSGHAKQEELKTMFSLVKPKRFIPVHGEHIMQHANINLALSCGVKNSQLLENGDVLEVERDSWGVTNRMELTPKLVEGESKKFIDYDVLKQRLKVAEMGLVVCGLLYRKTEDFYEVLPGVTIQGIATHDEEEQIRADIQKTLKDLCDEYNDGDGVKDFPENCRIQVRKVFNTRLGIKPVTIIQIHEV